MKKDVGLDFIFATKPNDLELKTKCSKKITTRFPEWYVGRKETTKGGLPIIVLGFTVKSFRTSILSLPAPSIYFSF